MELTLTGFGILFVLFAWNCAFLPALKGRCIDQLEDLREDNARFFGKNSSEDAARLRRSLDSLLSAQIKNIDRVSIIGFLILSAWNKNNPQFASALDERIEERFQTKSLKNEKFADQIRRQASAAIFIYMGRSYSWLWVIASFAAPFLLIHRGYRVLWQSADEVAKTVLSAMSQTEVEPEETKRILEDTMYVIG